MQRTSPLSFLQTAYILLLALLLSHIRLVAVFSSIWITHHFFELLQVWHSRWARHVMPIVPQSRAIPPNLILMQSIHDHWRVNVRADLNHLAPMPTREPHIDNIKSVTYGGSE